MDVLQPSSKFLGHWEMEVCHLHFNMGLCEWSTDYGRNDAIVPGPMPFPGSIYFLTFEIFTAKLMRMSRLHRDQKQMFQLKSQPRVTNIIHQKSVKCQVRKVLRGLPHSYHLSATTWESPSETHLRESGQSSEPGDNDFYYFKPLNLEWLVTMQK